MTPHLSNQRGTLMLDLCFGGVGRIRRASGTLDTRTFNEIRGMLSAFYSQGRHDLLVEVRDGRLRPLTALTWFRQNRLDKIPVGESLRPFLAAYLAWSARFEGSDEHRRSHRKTARALGLTDSTTMHEVPGLLAAYVAAHQATARRSCELAKSNLMAFFRDALKTSHPLYRAVQDVALPRRAHGHRRQRKGRPLPVSELRALCQRLDQHAPGAGGMAWTMATTGMGNREYWSKKLPWVVAGDRVQIPGEKRAGRDRIVPSFTVYTRPLMGEVRFRKLLREASGDRPVRIYDFRRTFSRATEEAGIVETNAAAYMGHGPKTMTQLYRVGVLPGQLEADARRLAAYFGEAAPAAGLRRVK